MTLQGKTEELARRRQAVAELYETHYERVSRYITVRIGNLAEAQDLASEVFVRALRSIDTYQETGAPMEAWVFRIAHNLVVDHLRRKSRRPAATPLDALPADPSINPNLGENLERESRLEELKKALDQLSEAQRQVIALRFSNEEMTSEEVAKILGKKPGAIREMQSAAIKRLRSILGEGRPQGKREDG
ncbi:MAG: sigma-70 family RNA polymerase sigma factor [Chloroflexi bacterium]|nr:sigma-70 family RNA polymerase sigma factor [Chloroflexota bacterium]